MSSDHYLDAKKAFVAISLFNILRVAISFAPMAVNKTIKVRASSLHLFVSLIDIIQNRCGVSIKKKYKKY